MIDCLLFVSSSVPWKHTTYNCYIYYRTCRSTGNGIHITFDTFHHYAVLLLALCIVIVLWFDYYVNEQIEDQLCSREIIEVFFCVCALRFCIATVLAVVSDQFPPPLLPFSSGSLRVLFNGNVDQESWWCYETPWSILVTIVSIPIKLLLGCIVCWQVFTDQNGNVSNIEKCRLFIRFSCSTFIQRN